MISIVLVSLLIAGVLSVVCLLIFVLINKKWKPCNIDAIEFKTKYYSNKVEEPLLGTYGDTERIPMADARQENASTTADVDQATVLVDVIIAPQSVDDAESTRTTVASKQAKKSVAKTKPKIHFKHSEDARLIDSDEEHLDFSIQPEVK